MNGDKPVLIGSEAINNILRNPLPDIREQILSRNDLFEITDDNMAVEYKKKLKYFFNPDMSWGEMYKRLFWILFQSYHNFSYYKLTIPYWKKTHCHW